MPPASFRLTMAEQAQIGISRIYIKDLSFESLEAPEVFRREFQPEIKVDVSVRNRAVDNMLYEICVEVTATGTLNGKKVFVVEVEQAGLFQIQGVGAEHLNHVLQVYCPNILFPYARQVIDASMIAGSFPPLMLPPFNFEMLLRPSGSQAEIKN